MVIVQQYLQLTPEEEEEMGKLMAQPQNQPVVEFMSPWRREGWEKGLLEGRQEGKGETLIRQLRVKFGGLPEGIEDRVRNLEGETELDAYLDRVVTATSLDEVGLANGSH